MTHGPSLASAAFLGFLLIGCGDRDGAPATGDQEVDPAGDREVAPIGETGDLVGTAWRLVSLGEAAALDPPVATLEFPEAGRVAGNGSCNRFFGSVEISGEAISFGQLGSTRMACDEPVMNQETDYLQALADAERFSLEGSEFLIYSKGLDRPLRFARMGS